MKTYRIAIFHDLVSGGAKRSIYEYTKALSGRGHEIDLFTLNLREDEFLSVGDYVGKVIAREFKPVLSMGDHTFLLSPLRSYEIKRLEKVSCGIAQEIEAGRYDVAFIHNSRYTQCPLVLKYLRQIPTVYYCHETIRFLTESHPNLGTVRDRFRQVLLTLLRSYMTPVSRLERENIDRADMVLTNSDFTRENLLRAYGLNAEVCYQGVDVEHFRFLDIERENFVLSVGQLTRWKSQDFLVRALSLLPKRIRPALVLVYDKGSDSYRRFLEEQAGDREVKLSFRCGISDEELVRLYNRARAFVYAPIREPFGFVPLEAMACGTPVVAVLEGGVREVVVQGSGAFGVKRDPEEFARALKKLLDSSDIRRRAAEDGRDYVLSRWTWEKAAERLENKIGDLIRRKG